MKQLDHFGRNTQFRGRCDTCTSSANRRHQEGCAERRDRESRQHDERPRVRRLEGQAAGIQPTGHDRADHCGSDGAADRSLVTYCSNKRALVDGLNRDSELFANAKEAIYATPTPLLKRAQASGDVRQDLDIEDVMYLVSGLMSVTYRSEEQRERVLALALDGIRPPADK